VYSLREDIDWVKWVVQWRLIIPWTTPLPVGALFPTNTTLPYKDASETHQSISKLNICGI
jgi:hypothetical protein